MEDKGGRAGGAGAGTGRAATRSGRRFTRGQRGNACEDSRGRASRRCQKGFDASSKGHRAANMKGGAKERLLRLHRLTQRMGTTAALHRKAMIWPRPAAAQPMKLAKSWLPISAGLPGKLPAAGGYGSRAAGGRARREGDWNKSNAGCHVTQPWRKHCNLPRQTPCRQCWRLPSPGAALSIALTVARPSPSAGCAAAGLPFI